MTRIESISKSVRSISLLTWAVAACLVFTASATTGCSTAGTTATLEETPSGEYAQYISTPNSGLRRKLSIESMAMRNAGDLRQVQAVLRNLKNSTQRFQYKVVWYDASGFAIDSESRPWNPVTLRGKDTFPVQATAPRASATTFKIHVKD